MKTLLIVDVQKGFITPEYKDIPGKIRAHIEKSQYDYILFGMFINKKESNFVTLLNWDKLYTSPEIDIVSELAEYIHKDQEFWRTSYSVCKAQGFIKFLESNKIREFDICGLVADSCVLATAYEAFDLGYKVNVLRELMQTKENLNEPTEDIIKRNIDQQVK